MQIVFILICICIKNIYLKCKTIIVLQCSQQYLIQKCSIIHIIIGIKKTLLQKNMHYSYEILGYNVNNVTDYLLDAPAFRITYFISICVFTWYSPLFFSLSLVVTFSYDASSPPPSVLGDQVSSYYKRLTLTQFAGGITCEPYCTSLLSFESKCCTFPKKACRGCEWLTQWIMLWTWAISQ